jgi:hypothetical protein
MDTEELLKQLEEIPDEFKFVGTVVHPQPKAEDELGRAGV